MKYIAIGVALSATSMLSIAHDAQHNPLGITHVNHNWPAIKRVLHAGYGDTFGTEAYPRTGKPKILKNGCVQASNLMFDIDDAHYFDVTGQATLSFSFVAPNSMRVQLAYDAGAKAEQQTWLKLQASNDIQTISVDLNDARFVNRGLANTDFALITESSVTEQVPDQRHDFTLCDLKISAVNNTSTDHVTAQFNFTADNKPSAVRFGLYDANTGRKVLASDQAIDLYHYSGVKKQHYMRSLWDSNDPWPHPNRYFIYSPSSYQVDVTPGEYWLVASKGPEFDLHKSKLTISGDNARFTIDLERRNTLPSWYSGDGHVHMLRDHPDRNQAIANIADAEDINLFNLLQMGNLRSEYFNQYAFGKEGRFSKKSSHLVSGVENPRTAVRGHSISHNISKSLYNQSEYFDYYEQLKGYQEQGGITGYAHVDQGWYNEHRGLALDVALGVVDFVEVMQQGHIKTDIWYDFLNMGVKLAPMAGSDYPYIDSPGSVRIYAKPMGEFSVDGWYDAVKRGRSFVTNGPMVAFSVNGAEPGSELSFNEPTVIKVKADIKLLPTFDQLDRAQLIVNGKAVKSFEPDEHGKISFTTDLMIESGAWIAILAKGKQYALAHTGAVYINYQDKGHGLADKKLLANKMLGYLDQLDEPANASAELEYHDIHGLVEEQWSLQRPMLDEQIERARGFYRLML